ncbi:MAG: GNAT family N-acetyltransferase [Aestuariivirga sp.]
MSIAYRPMRQGQEDAVASFIRQIPKDLGLAITPRLSGETLRSWRGDVHIVVADNAGLLCGACVWFITYSTWRAAKGAFISDVFVLGHLRGRSIGANLIKAAAREADKQGASFLRLDVTTITPRPRKFYEKLGFNADEDDLSLFLEPDNFKTLITEKKS